jgi:hypothetical protein
MNIKDIIKLVLVLLVFLGIIFGNMLVMGIQEIKDNWPKYKCNPMIMPFAESLGYDSAQNFSECIGGIMESLMGKFLGPINSTLDMTNQVGGALVNDIGNIKMGFPKLKGMNFKLGLDLNGAFSNIIIKVQKMVIKIKDMVSKVGATAGIIMNITDGLSMAGVSFNCGPNGDFIRFASGDSKPGCCDNQTCCFHPNTKIKLNNGTYKKIKDIDLNDTLENNIDVIATMKIKGDEKYYKLYSEKLNNYIYVTGSHHILKNINDDKYDLDNYIFVKDHKKAIKTNMTDKIYYCLVTNNHTIPIGEYIFWDWED